MAGLLNNEIRNFTLDGRIYKYKAVFLFYDNLCVYPAQRIDSLEISPEIKPSNFLSYFERNTTKKRNIVREMRD
jgi:hypothetical protein